MSRFVRTEKIKTWAFFVAALASAVWAGAMVVLVVNYDDLVDKNERLVVIVQDLEGQNKELNDRLQCRIDQNDVMMRAIGNGLVAVAHNDDAALEAQAEEIVRLSSQQPCS